MTDLFYCNRANRWAVAYLAALVVALLVFWQVGFVSYNPLKFDVTHIVGPDGLPTTVLKTGAVIGVHRSICSTENIGVQFFPFLRDETGQQFTLPPGVYDVKKGCTERAYGFVVPDIPPGEYTYICAMQFQSSLVGRSEVVMAPSVRIRIVK